MKSKTKKGGFFGVSLGVGDPMNITVYALRVLNGVPVIAVPQSKKDEQSVALERIKKMPVHLDDKTVLELYMPMKKGDISTYWQSAAKSVIEFLSQGIDVAFAGIGDLLHYGTFYYIERYVKDAGFETLYVPGITSYQVLASNLNFPLVQGNEKLLITPDDNLDICEIADFDTIVFLKKPSNEELFKKLSEDYTLYLGKNLGLKGERFGIIENVKKDMTKLPYFSLIIAKKRHKNV